MAELCKCPVLDGVDSYFAGFIEMDLGVDRKTCPGGYESELGEMLCPAMVSKQESSADMMKPVGDAAEEFLKLNETEED